MHRLLVLSASTRTASAGRPLATWLAGLAAGRAEFDTSLVDLRALALPFLDEPEHPSGGRYVHQHTKEWSATVDAADCFVFVLPMYNGGFSAPLKNAIDHLHAEWQGKPVGLVSYSAGTSGGAPALDMLRPVLSRVGLRPAEPTLSVPGIEERVAGGDLRVDRELEASAGAVLDGVAALAGSAGPAAGAGRQPSASRQA